MTSKKNAVGNMFFDLQRKILKANHNIKKNEKNPMHNKYFF